MIRRTFLTLALLASSVAPVALLDEPGASVLQDPARSLPVPCHEGEACWDWRTMGQPLRAGQSRRAGEVLPMSATYCCCAHHDDGSVTTSLCPLHAKEDPCARMALVTRTRRRGSIRRGVCSNCGWNHDEEG